MQHSGRDTRRTAAGLAAIAAGAALIIGGLPGGAGAAPMQEATPTTSEVPGNPTCGDLAPEGTTWVEVKIEEEDIEDGATAGDVTITDVYDTEDGQAFDWESTIGIDAVFVKGGPGGLLWTYDPPAESMGDEGLHAPVNPENDMYYGLSHVSFCYDEDDEETTTSTTEKGEETTTTEKGEETTTTEKGEETTTTEKGEETTTTVEGETTSTTAAGEVTTTTVSEGELPRTGNNTAPMLGLGAALLAGGTALIAGTRRLRNSQN